jgi:hypothetical protein
MIERQLLLVEGGDDQHVIWSLLAHHKFPEVFKVDDKKGISKVISTFPVQLKSSNLDTLGVVVDADLDVANRWRSIRDKLVDLGYQNCPDDPPRDGLILCHPEMPRFGAWLMPDNELPGMLEDFVAHLVPEGDALWGHCQLVLQNLPSELRRFSDAHLCKALIHMWLALQDDPGTPMGLAITKKYLKGEAQVVDAFLGWLKRLFVDR